MVVFGFWFLLLDFVFCVVEVEPKVTVEVPLRSGCPLSSIQLTACHPREKQHALDSVFRRVGCCSKTAA